MQIAGKFIDNPGRGQGLKYIRRKKFRQKEISVRESWQQAYRLQARQGRHQARGRLSDEALRSRTAEQQQLGPRYPRGHKRIGELAAADCCQPRLHVIHGPLYGWCAQTEDFGAEGVAIQRPCNCLQLLAMPQLQDMLYGRINLS